VPGPPRNAYDRQRRAEALTRSLEYTQLQDAGRVYTTALKNLRQATDVRDDAIIRAAHAGLSRREIARAAGVTVGRVQQIIDAYRRV
jgi:DNA-directed RNA polymerase specialized sigma24 family protein